MRLLSVGAAIMWQCKLLVNAEFDASDQTFIMCPRQAFIGKFIVEPS